MSETTATLMRPLARGVTLVAFVAAWIVAAILLWKTSVPSLDLSSVDAHRYFSSHEIARSHRFARGERLIWLLSTLATIVALVVLTRRLPRYVDGMGLGRVGSAIVVGMLILVTLWFVGLPFGLAGLWWQHHWGLGPFDVFAWLVAQRYALGASVTSVLITIVVVVSLAAKFGRRWWIPGGAFFILIATLFGFLGGWLGSAGSHSIRSAQLRSDVAKIEQREGVHAPVHVLVVSDWTSQANAFSAGFGPSANVVLWDTLFLRKNHFSRGEVNVVVAHELGHVKSRHILKGLAWFALLAFPAAFLVAEATRRRGGVERPGNLPFALLVLTLVSLAAAPFENAVSRRYEAEADWHALNATRDPASARELFRQFERTSLEEPNPPLWDYLWLENHPTLMQRIAMTQRWRDSRR